MLRPVCPTLEIVRELVNSGHTFGRLFTGLDVDTERERGRLSLSQEAKVLYPDDDAVGALYVHGEVELTS